MPRTALVVHPSPTNERPLIQVASIPDETNPESLKALQDLVGGYIQLVPVEDESISCFCNEEGKLLDMEPNRVATGFTGFWPHDYISGSMVILGEVDEEGNTRGLTGEQQYDLTQKLLEIEKNFHWKR